MILFKYELKYSFYYKDKGDEMEKRVNNCSCNFLEAMCNLFYCIPKVKCLALAFNMSMSNTEIKVVYYLLFCSNGLFLFKL